MLAREQGRLIRDAHIAKGLPKEIPHAIVRSEGETTSLSWVLTERASGDSFARTVDKIPESEARGIVSQMARILKALHDWEPDDELRSMIQSRPSMNTKDPLSVWGTELVPVPAWQALAQGDLAKGLPHVKQGLINATIELIEDLSEFDPYQSGSEQHVVLHGDPSLGNWFVENGLVTSLLDFEWFRIGPRDLDLVTLICVCQRDAHDQPGPPRVPFLKCLEVDYPEMFDYPNLNSRLWLYELAFFLRGVIWWPPNKPAKSLDREHHVHTLSRLLDGPLPR